MPTECERSVHSLGEQQQLNQQQQSQNQQQKQQQPQQDFSENMEESFEAIEPNGEMSTSQTSTTSSNGHNELSNGSGRKTSITSPDPTAYVAKARVTRPTPPPPSYNPMQFVQIKPCNLYQTAQQQLKKAEEVKKIKEIKKEEPEEWQNNLDNWKSSRRKRVEHIIDRVVEVKKLELEEHDRSRRKSKTFSEMIEERGDRPRTGRAKLASLAVYNEDESNDLSDLGIGTSSASGKSSLSEDYDNNSVLSDNAELDKVIYENKHKQNSKTREYISSPGYDTSSSTAPGSSPDPCEYTYEGAIQDYKQRVSRAQTANGGINFKHNNNIKPISSTSNDAMCERATNNGHSDAYPTRRGSKIEDRLMGFEVTSPSDSQEGVEKQKVDVPKIDISKRKEIFENQNANNEPKSLGNGVAGGAAAAVGVPKVTLRERFKFDATTAGNTEAQQSVKKEVKRLSGDIGSIRNRLQSLEQQQNLVNSTTSATSKLVDIPVPPLKERLSSLQNAVTKEEVKKPPVVLVDARQLEIMQHEEETAQQLKKQQLQATEAKKLPEVEEEVDRDDSGIHTADDNEAEERIMAEQLLHKAQEQQLNAAIAALAMEEQQLEQAANAVNQIEAEFAELTSTPSTTTVPGVPGVIVVSATNDPPCEMEFSINEALELALEAIDKETHIKGVKHDEDNDDNVINVDKAKTINNTVTNYVQNIQNDTQQQNKTDEEKELKSKSINFEFDKAAVDKDVEEEVDEATTDDIAVKQMEAEIFMEPIYENISTASTFDLDTVTKIIPNTNINTNNNNNKLISNHNNNNHNHNNNHNNNSKISKTNSNNLVELTNAFANTTTITTTTATNEINKITATTTKTVLMSNEQQQHQPQPQQLESEQPKFPPALIDTIPPTITKQLISEEEPEPYYQVPKSSEPYYDAPKHLRPIPLYENIEIFYTGLENSTIIASSGAAAFKIMEPPKEKPPPPPTESQPLFDDEDTSVDMVDNWSSSDNTYETITSRLPPHLVVDQPSPPIKRVNSTKRIKKELRNKRSSFLGIEGCSLDDEESYLELTVAPPPAMAQLLQEERRLEKQLYMKAGLCDSSDTGESRDSGVSENHSRQSSEHYTNSSEENERNGDHHMESVQQHNQSQSVGTGEVIYQNETPLLTAAQTPLLQTVKGNSADAWTESATAAAAATKSLTEATATANAKMHSIEEKIREQEEVLRVERELLQLEQEELKRQRENLMLRENMARRELQHGAKMLMSANRRSLQDLNGVGVVAGMQTAVPQPLLQQQQQHHAPQQIYANVPNLQQQYYQVDTDYRKSMSDLNEFSKRLQLAGPPPPTKPMRTMHVSTSNALDADYAARQRHSLVTASQSYGGSLVKIATPTAAPRGAGVHIYSNYHHQSAHNLASNLPNTNGAVINGHHAAPAPPHHGNMTRNTLHALSATPKPKYTDGWVQVQNRKSYDTNLASDPAWLSAYQQKRKSMPDAYHAYNNHWLVQETEQRHAIDQQQRRSISTGNTPVHQPQQQQQNGIGAAKTSGSNGKPLPDAIIQSLTERVQSKGIGERKRFDNYNSTNNIEKSPLHAAAYHHHQQQQQQQQQKQQPQFLSSVAHRHPSELNPSLPPQQTNSNTNTSTAQDKVLSVSGKKKCSHCGDELGRGAAMIIESLLLFYHINCFKCCVCHVQLGDGLNGTDVRVRNHKLHCQNCYSSDDGIKFSCV